MARPRSNIAPRILHAARARFLRQGVEGTSLREVAADAKTNIGMIYYYFPTKEALFLAVVEEVYGAFLGDAMAALDPDVPFEQRVRRLANRVGEMSSDEFDVIRLVVREVLVSSARRAEISRRFRTGHVPIVLQTLLEGLSTGAISGAHHPAVCALAVFGCVGAAQMMRRLADDQLPPSLGVPSGARLADALVDLLMQGMAPRPTPDAKTAPEGSISGESAPRGRSPRAARRLTPLRRSTSR